MDREDVTVAQTTAPTLGFWSLAAADPTHLAVVTPDERHAAAGELLALTHRVTHGLRALGLRRGDAVAVVLPNCLEFIAVYLACTQSGLYLVPVNTHLRGPEIAYIVDNSEARVLVGHERFADACAHAAGEISFPRERRFAIGAIDSFRPFAELIADQPDTLPADRTPGMTMNYTSGTTGRPKGVRRPLTAGEPEATATALCGHVRQFGLEPGGQFVHLVGSPLYHTAVLGWAAGALHLGHTLVLMDKWDAERGLALIEKYRVSSTHMVPTQFSRLLKLPDEVRARYDVSSLRQVVHAAAPCPVEVKRKMIDWFGPIVHEYYGATEAGGTMALAEDWLVKPGTVGYPYPGAEIAIFDDGGNRLTEPGAVGTVYMANASTFEYFKDAEKTARSRIGRFVTAGDFGYLDRDGWLFLRDRRTDIVISGGVNIYPAEIEGILVEHPSVRDAAVFGIPNSDWGQEVKAVIEPAAEVRPTDELRAELLRYCMERLAKYKVPKSIDFVDELPRDPNGKLYKRGLRDPYWEGHEGAVPR
jgi:long-chain acyl-CoA synthetase